ncbi:Thiol:disulfide interchange protein TlpA [Chryseobacterium aquaeductus]|uniref:Thiol:disulfide interchange protein TlpA n=1 Tax=Chryseobacterium aquaeductus TaxID=2675056 RepID=A0A9N8MGG3_9FLAO|nr:thioredoxin family protein [Chryseobacterium aquaeductus]CAA7331336.1 Thiol:disulfide interchange protein TlpA [Chryseobacterium potabilaquae]CAD7809594.1 Thiol:disulfide interchange protein TlpA [Chryseobacterium aquaeductus]
MKQIMTFLMMSFFTFGCSQKAPEVSKTQFSKEALQQNLEDENGKPITIQEILNQHKGKVLVIDFWAGWCRDCLKALPKAEELERNNPNIDFVFFSLERSKEKFDSSLVRFNMKEKENYWFSVGWENDFNKYIDLNWIPRYMVIDQKSEIAKYYAISPEDPEIQATIDRLLK